VDVADAVRSRMSCRAFLNKPVAENTLREILDIARQSPSGGNLQPWRIYALTGGPLGDFLKIIRGKMTEHPRGEGSEYEIYPPGLKEPYRSRRYKCGEDMYATIGVSREDKLARLMQFAENYRFFGAPVGLFFCIDREMGPPQWADLGMYMQTVMLLARERGLHSCAQEAWSVWHPTIESFLQLPPELMVFSGMALGYRDDSAAINSLRTERAALEAIASLKGF
jgi:nitroreductase